MAESAVHTAKRYFADGKVKPPRSIPSPSGLSQQPRDTVLGSPVQRLFSWRTKTTLPTSEGILTPQIVEPFFVKARLQELKQQQKLHYDEGYAPLQPLKEGDVVKMNSVGGFDSQATVRSPEDQPKTHVVSRDGVTYQ